MDFHPFADDYPLMPEVELHQLAGRIKDGGFNKTFPIVRFQGKILDGRNRFKGCEISGVDPVYRDFNGTEEEAKQFVIDANEHRRHLAPEWLAKRRQERVQRVMQASRNGQSTRSIAEQEGVSQSQVQRDKQHGTEPGGSVEPKGGKVKGKDGKKRKAAPKGPKTPKVIYLCARCSRVGTPACKKCKEKKNPIPDPRAFAKPPDQPQEDREPGDETPESAESVKDAEGQVVPAQAIAAFVAADTLTEICREIDGIIRRVEEIAKGDGGRLIRFDSFKQQIKDAKGNLWANRATHVCPYCHGKKDNCEACKGSGWTAKHVWQQAPGNREKAK